jgi:hypothetical protein
MTLNHCVLCSDGLAHQWELTGETRRKSDDKVVVRVYECYRCKSWFIAHRTNRDNDEEWNVHDLWRGKL